MKKIALQKDKIYEGDLILVNHNYPYNKDSAESTLMPIEFNDNSILVKRQCANIFTRLMDELRSWEHIYMVSGFRSQQEQEQIYNESLLENGAYFTAKYVALPGCSEHQTGLALDLALNHSNIDFLRPYFPDTGVCGIFKKKANCYGFIERYPKGKENITSIANEPWHFRYVGVPHAALINHFGDALEEYHERLKQFPYGGTGLNCGFSGLSARLFYLPADKEVSCFEIEDDTIYTVSGNNIDGFIITVWGDNQ